MKERAISLLIVNYNPKRLESQVHLRDSASDLRKDGVDIIGPSAKTPKSRIGLPSLEVRLMTLGPVPPNFDLRMTPVDYFELFCYI